MRLKLHWVDIKTGLERTPSLETPVAFGREFGSMPSTIAGQGVSRMVLADDQVEAYHAILTEEAGQLVITDRGSRICTKVNGVPLPRQSVVEGDQIQIGPFEITVTVLPDASMPSRAPDFRATHHSDAGSSAHRTVPPQATGAAPVSATPVSEAMMGMAASGSRGAQSQSTEATSVGNPSAGFGVEGLCDRKVGFLFKRRCGRTTTEGCPDCRNGQLEPNRNRYEDDYAYYPDYGRYGRGHWGYGYYHNRHHYYYDPHTRNVDFNESDAASFEEEGDQDFEMDLDAS